MTKDNRNIFVLISAVILEGIVIGIGGIWDYLYFNPTRLGTSFGQRLSFIRFLVLCVPLSCVVGIFIRNKLLKLSGLISSLLLLPCLIFNASRAAWVAVSSSLLIVCSVKNKRIAVLVLILIIIFILFSPPHLKERASTTLNPLAWGERVDLWKITSRMIEDFPVFGAGLGMYEKLFYKYWNNKHVKYWHAHNTYLETASESGVISFLSFLWIFIVFFKNSCLRLKNLVSENSIICLGLTGTLISALIFAFSASNLTVGVQEVAVFWFMFGMASGLSVQEVNKF